MRAGSCTANVQRWSDKGIKLPTVSDFDSDERSDFGEDKLEVSLER